MLLAAVGLYGVMAYSVTQRTRRSAFAWRSAPERQQVRGMVVRQGLFLAAGGVVLGVAGAFGLSRVVARLFFGIAGADPLTFAVDAGGAAGGGGHRHRCSLRGRPAASIRSALCACNVALQISVQGRRAGGSSPHKRPGCQPTRDAIQLRPLGLRASSFQRQRGIFSSDNAAMMSATAASIARMVSIFGTGIAM